MIHEKISIKNLIFIEQKNENLENTNNKMTHVKISIQDWILINKKEKKNEILEMKISWATWKC